MRGARIIDGLILYRWRNSYVVKKYFINQEKSTLRGHFHWYLDFLKSNDHKMYFFWKGLRRCGMTRLNRLGKSTEYEISILVSPKFHRQGLASVLLNNTLQVAVQQFGASRVIARVNHLNHPSIKTFTRFGFTQYQSDAFYEYLEFKLLEELFDA